MKSALLSSLTFILFETITSAEMTIPCIPEQPVDLGYAVHGVSFHNSTPEGRIINVYQNIRFADPPGLFQKPKFPPSTSRVKGGGVQTGNYTHDTRCVSAVPQGAEVLFPGLNGTSFGSEDCLLLDVYVPKSISCAAEGVDNNNNNNNNNFKPVPVIHWLYGSGYSFGSKEMCITPLGLFDQLLSQNKPFILVASNYRMGLYGWASSPYQNQTDANAGLYDALAALRWTERFIRHFGGDPTRVTAMGQSTGGAIIELLASGPGILPFQQAFISSSALPLKRNVTERRQYVFNYILEAANCTTLSCVQNVNATKLREVNRHLIVDVPSNSGGGNSGPGIGFGPVVDGQRVPDLPVANPSLQNELRRLKSLIISNMENEGTIVSSDQDMPDAFPGLVRRILPAATNETVATIQSLYHWSSEMPAELAWQWTADAVFVCHSLAVAEAFTNSSRRYVMTIPPAWHGLDQAYFFFFDNSTTPVANILTARSLQSLFGQFLYGNDPVQTKEGLEWVHYGSGSFLNISASGMALNHTNEEQIKRCRVINSIFSDRKNGI